jgi:D-sedoheptulose 7-phosphate isomerase
MKQTILNIIQTHRTLLHDFETYGVEVIEHMAALLCDCVRNNGCVYLCGNGGSAADAQHIAGEFVGRFEKDRRAFAAVALSTDTSVITAVANDYAYEDIFSRQMEALAHKGDLLWAFSTSGASKNVLKAVQVAKDRGIPIISFTGRKASPLEAISDCCLCVAHSSSARSQEIHQLAYHILCALVEQDCS